MAETLIIADLHLARPEPRMLALLDTFLERAEGAEAVYLLGDLFDYWIGDDQPIDPLIAERLERLRALSVPLYFLPGNRDFLVGEQLLARLGATRLPDQYILKQGGRRWLLTHGDELCTDDAAYQAMRAQLRDPVFVRDFLARALPERVAIAEDLRRKSRTASSSKPEDIMDINVAAVEEVLARTDTDGLIHGHTHRPAIHHRLPGGRPRVVTGDWGEAGWLVSLQDEVLTLERFTPEKDSQIVATWSPGREARA